MSTTQQLKKDQTTGNRSPAKESATTTTTTTTSILTTSSSSGTKTPQHVTFVSRNGAGTANTSRSSPVSPSRLTRLQEKEEMQNLNDRLVVYIDTVRRLESENSRLNSIVLSYTENTQRDINDIKKLYEQELEDAKRLIDDLARDKAKCEIEINKLKSDTDEASQKLAKRDKEAKAIEAKLKTADSEKIEYKSRYESLLSEQAHQADELSKLRPHVTDLEKQLQKLKKQLEEETLTRVDLENKNQTLKEEISFKSQLFAKEKDQLRSSKHVEIEQVDVRLRDEYDSRLVAEMQRIRDETDREIAKMKDQVERSYLNRVSDAESSVRRVNTQIAALKDERDSLKSKNDELAGEIKIFVTKITTLETKIKDLEEKLRKAQNRYDKDIAEKETEIAQLRKEIDEMLREYQELYDIKINLDTEIACYRKLLESEEHRLNISSSAANSSAQLGASYIEPSSATRSGKKRRLANTQAEQDEVSSTQVQYSHSHQSRGQVDIGDHDIEGRVCRLTNTSGEKEQPVGGWVLKRTADGQVVEYKLGKNVVLKPGQSINVHSANAGVSQDVAAGEFVLSGGQKWPVGDAMITLLVDKDGNEQARRESQRVVSSTVEKKLRSTPTRTPGANAGGQQSTSAVQKLFGLWKS